MNDPLNAERLATSGAGRQHIGRRVQVVFSTASTNDLAHEWAAKEKNGGLAIFAEHQTAGRGRMGRQWGAPPGSSLLFSLVLSPPQCLAGPSFLVAWSAAAIADQLRQQFGLDVRLKWPNDLLIGGRKLGGILLERRAATVIGIGLNIHTAPNQFPAELRLPATSLWIELGRRIDRTSLAIELLDRLDVDYVEATRLGTEPAYSRWTSHLEDILGQQVIARTAERAYQGILLKLHPESGATLRVDNRLETIPATRLVSLERIEARR